MDGRQRPSLQRDRQRPRSGPRRPYPRPDWQPILWRWLDVPENRRARRTNEARYGTEERLRRTARTRAARGTTPQHQRWAGRRPPHGILSSVTQRRWRTITRPCSRPAGTPPPEPSRTGRPAAIRPADLSTRRLSLGHGGPLAAIRGAGPAPQAVLRDPRGVHRGDQPFSILRADTAGNVEAVRADDPAARAQRRVQAVLPAGARSPNIRVLLRLGDAGAFGALKLRPVKHRHAQVDDAGIETEQAVFEPKLVAPGGQPELSAALAEQLLKDGFEQLPGPLPVGAGKRGALPTSRGA